VALTPRVGSRSYFGLFPPCGCGLWWGGRIWGWLYSMARMAQTKAITFLIFFESIFQLTQKCTQRPAMHMTVSSYLPKDQYILGSLTKYQKNNGAAQPKSMVSVGKSRDMSSKIMKWQCVKTNSTPVVHIKIAGIYGCSSP